MRKDNWNIKFDTAGLFVNEIIDKIFLDRGIKDQYTFLQPSDRHINSPELFDEFLSQEESEEEEELEYESAEGEIRYVIATDGVDLKKQESEDSESILKIPFGQQVWIMPMNDLWAYVEFDGEIGYCALEHLSSDNPLE